MKTSLFFASLTAVIASITGCQGKHSDSSYGYEDSSVAGHYAGVKLTAVQVKAELLKAGFPNDEKILRNMVCAAFNESGFWTEAYNVNSNGSYDMGLFQINDIHTPAGMTKAEFRKKLKDVGYNTKTALRVYKMQGYKAWYGWQKGCNTTAKVDTLLAQVKYK